MPLFFFHLRRQGMVETDPDGTSFKTLEDAVNDAHGTLRELVADELKAGKPSDIAGIEITDGDGNTVATVTIDEAVLKPLAKDTSYLE